MSMEWKTINHRSGNIEYCYIGKIAVASVQWDFGQTKGTNLTHRAVVNLPHLKNNFSNTTHAGEKSAKEYVERLIKGWVDAAGLEFK